VIPARLNPKELGRLLRQVREAANLTQLELAKRLRVPYQNLSRLENGAREGMLSTINRYVRALGWELVIIARPRKSRSDEPEPDAPGAEETK
jgi:transcriptional regulator with XRE-family HTH domain